MVELLNSWVVFIGLWHSYIFWLILCFAIHRFAISIQMIEYKRHLTAIIVTDGQV